MKELNLKDFTSMLFRKKIMVLIIMIVFTLMGVIYSYKVVKSEYKSSTKLIFGTSNAQNEVNVEEVKLDDKLFSTCEELIKSKGLTQRVKNGLNIKIDEKLFLENIEVSKSDNNYIQITVTNKDRKMSTDIANEIAIVFLDRIEKIYSIDNVYIAEAATEEGASYNVNHFRDMIIFVSIGLIFTIIYISIYVMSDVKIKSVEDIEKEVGIRNLISIPTKKRTKKESISNLVIYEKQKSVAKEAFETLRKNVQFSNINNKESKVMLVTSCFSAEGKSYVSANLAAVFAEVGKKVILIDTDMRRGSQAGIFNIPNELGLSNYLSNLDSNGVEINERINKYIKETEIKNLNIITSGSVPPNPSELLTLSKLPELIKELSIFYDLIILDGAPVLPITDSLILSRLANSTILVTLYNMTRKDELFKAKRDIQNVGGRIIGTVLNRAPFSNLKYENKYHYDEIGMMNSANKDRNLDTNNKKFKKFCKKIIEKVETRKNNKGKSEVKLLTAGNENTSKYVKEDSQAKINEKINREEAKNREKERLKQEQLLKKKQQEKIELEKQRLREELVRKRETELAERKLIKEDRIHQANYEEVTEVEQYSIFNESEKTMNFEEVKYDDYLEDEIMFDENSKIIEQAKLEFELEERKRKEKETQRQIKKQKQELAKRKRKELMEEIAKSAKRTYNKKKRQFDENKQRRIQQRKVRRREEEIRREEELKIREEKERIRTRENAKREAERQAKIKEIKAEKERARLEKNKELEKQKQIRLENRLQKKMKIEQVKEERRKYKEEELLRQREQERMQEEMLDDNLYPKTKYNKDLM